MNKKSKNRIAYKYRSGDDETISRDIKFLIESKFFAAEVNKLNDPFEGVFKRDQIDLYQNEVKSFFAKFKNNSIENYKEINLATEKILNFNKDSGVFSMSNSPLIELIWAHYGGSHKGFCVGYETEKLISFDSSHMLLDVRYSDTTPDIKLSHLLCCNSPELIVQEMLGVKSKSWSYEKEVRVITNLAGAYEYDYRAVREIYFGFRCHESTKIAIMKALAGRNVIYRQITSPKSSYILNSEFVKDSYIDSTPYMENYAPILDGAIPNIIDSKYEKYAEYLYKAAEIIRREPYCPAVECVEFSTSKISSGKPVIYVRYQRAPNKWLKHYMTIKEIDENYDNLKKSKA